MEKEKKFQLIIVIIFLVDTLFFLQPVSSLTASSENYSVGMFGTGITASNPSSSNYSTESLSTTQSGTRNSKSSSYTANIGFFNDTVPSSVTVSTTSYSISPSSFDNGGNTTIIEKCTYIWDCTPWKICSEGKQTRECKNKGTCNGTENKPIEEISCSEALFDIVLELKDIELTKNKTLKFNIDLTEKIGIEKIDVQIKYSIINESGAEIFSQIETKTIQKSLSYEKEIDEVWLVDGEYSLRVDILYNNLQIAFAEQKIKIVDEKINFEEPVSNIQKTIGLLNNYKIIISIISIIILFGGLSFIFKKENHQKRFGKLIKGKIKYIFTFIATLIGQIKYMFIFIAILLFGILAFISGLIGALAFTGKAIFNIISKESSLLGLFVLVIISTLGWLIWKYKKKIKDIVEETLEKFVRKYPSNGIKRLIRKKVYSESGYYLGKVKEVILRKNRIENLIIKVDKKYKFKKEGIIVNYKDVRSIGKILIIDKDILEKIGSLKD